ncbi:E3 ubiquitin-protein ligase TRIM33-like [Patella vulgata]|uniref:E3 ubiquitin-protein ligase TRIM33-like n=1 Tax=Patella vulgata TaxID=6465 RepID=UPI00217F92B7|nr:E3 ubiquitin-protein ligase TRIM33-like [Patella vulgata]
MAEQTDKEVCSICLNDFHQPKTIDCQHSFCFTCLEDYVHRTATNDHFLCPLCRFDMPIPKDGVGAFKPSHSTINNPQCDVCTNVVSVFKCKDCPKYLCESCKTMHDTFCEDHIVIKCNEPLSNDGALGADKSPVTSPRDFCSNHQKKGVEYFCNNCSMAVCSNCFVVGHNGHGYLDLQVESVREEIRGELKTLNQEIKTHIDKLEKFSESLNMKYCEVNDSVKTACDKVDEQVNIICSEVRKIGDQLKDKMKKDNANVDVNIQLKKLMDDIQKLTEDLKVSVKYSVNVLEDSSIVQVLQRLPHVRQEKDESLCRTLDIPDVRYSKFQVAEIDQTLLTNQLGKIVSCNQNMVEDIFNVRNMPEYPNPNVLNGKLLVVSGFTWRIGIYRFSSTLRVRLYLYDVEDKRITSCKVDVTNKVINKTDDRQSVVKQVDMVLRRDGGNSYVYNDLMTWEELCKPNSGFVDHDNFTIETTINKISDIKRRL